MNIFWPWRWRHTAPLLSELEQWLDFSVFSGGKGSYMYSPMSFNLCAAIGSTPLARLRLTIALQNPSISDASSNVNNPLSWRRLFRLLNLYPRRILFTRYPSNFLPPPVVRPRSFKSIAISPYVWLSRSLSISANTLNPPPKIEFHRYCKGLYANFMHPLVKKKIL